MKSLCGKAFILLVGFSSAAFACEEKISFSDHQVKEALRKITSLNKNDFAIVSEFNRLLCAERKIVRDSAREAGKRSNIVAIQSMALQSALFEKDVINLTVLPTENMSEPEQKFLNENPLISYPVVFVDRKKGCLSLYDSDECDSKYLLSISGSEVDLRYGDNSAKLRLTKNGKLRGVWVDPSNDPPISVGVQIRLD